MSVDPQGRPAARKQAWKIVCSWSDSPHLISHLTLVRRFSGGYSRLYEEREKQVGRKETKTSPYPHPPSAKEPTLRNSQDSPLPPAQPNPIRNPPTPQPPPLRKGPVFEDACGGGLCSHHRITVGVTGLDTSVRCYPPHSYPQTRAFRSGKVGRDHHCAVNCCVKKKELICTEGLCVRVLFRKRYLNEKNENWDYCKFKCTIFNVMPFSNKK